MLIYAKHASQQHQQRHNPASLPAAALTEQLVPAPHNLHQPQQPCVASSSAAQSAAAAAAAAVLHLPLCLVLLLHSVLHALLVLLLLPVVMQQLQVAASHLCWPRLGCTAKLLLVAALLALASTLGACAAEEAQQTLHFAF
jgi:hypothetical protein